jgi:glycosyltransferase involved in cell wall biosynthesis
VKPGSDKALADALERLLRNPEETARMGQAARRVIVNQYNNRYEAHKLLRFYKKVLGQAS